jgi:hypothetical protein
VRGERTVADAEHAARGRRPDQASRAEPPAVEHVLALQATAGNRATVARLQAQPARVLQRQPAQPLTAQGATAAAAATTRRYTADSIRFVEALMQQVPDGRFSDADAQALARLQQSSGLTPSGQPDVAFLNAVLSSMTGATGGTFRAELIQLVADHAGLDLSGALSVEFDASLAAASAVDFSPGGVRTIRIGPAGFASYAVLLGALRTRLGTRAPAATVASSVTAGTLSSPVKQQEAITFNAAKLTDPRSIRLVQGTILAPVSGRWDVATVRQIAADQIVAGRAGDGKLDQATVEAIATELITNSAETGALQVIVDYYDLDRTHAFQVRFEPQQLTTAGGSQPNAQTLRPTAQVGTGGTVQIFPVGIAQPFAGLVHTLAHELGHVDQVFHGIASDELREFLSECIELESKGMPEELIETPAEITAMIGNTGPPATAGFVDDLMAMLRHWRALTTAERIVNVARYRQVRTLVFDRIRTRATPAQQTSLRPLVLLLQSADLGIP